MNVSFITGASGFIGKHLLKIILSRYGRDHSSRIKILSRHPHPDYETIICDLQSDIIPFGALKDVDTVFHLAGCTHDMRDDSKVKNFYQKINVDATVQLAELAVQSGVKKFIFVSSVKAGGGAVTGQCVTEKVQNEPEGIYGKTKREAELKLLEIGRKSNMHVSVVRPCLVYGPNVKGNLRLMLSGIQKGWFPPLPETGNRRSMIHVDDLVKALLLVAEYDHTKGEIYIATDGETYSSRKIYEVMCAGLGKPALKWSVPMTLFDLVAAINPTMRYKVNKLLGDECYSSKKLEKLGFKAKKTLRDMNETDF